MDSFKKCRLASERVAWSFEDALADLCFDHEKHFIPSMLCGKQLPAWMSAKERQVLNQVRGYSYAHMFDFIEEFILRQTCETASGYVHSDIDAVSAVLNFANEETKHQRMFRLVKSLLEPGFGFRPKVLTNKEEVARFVCQHSPFAVYLMTLTVEWLTQRHYIECFSAEDALLDPGFVRIFRLHWTEEAQHARLDAIELEALAREMSEGELEAAVHEYVDILHFVRGLLTKQDALDLESCERLLGEPFVGERRQQLLNAMHREYLWTFILSGLEHKAFQMTFEKLVPLGVCSVMELSGSLGAGLHTEGGAQLSSSSGAHVDEGRGHEGKSGDRGVEGRARGMALVVDDQEYILEFARSALGYMGFDVLTARSGKEGVCLFEENSDQLNFVLLDVTMPGMSGTEALEAMHARDPRVPVVLSSGHMRDDVFSGMPSGKLSGYLQKPYMLADLEEAVTQAIGGCVASPEAMTE